MPRRLGRFSECGGSAPFSIPNASPLRTIYFRWAAAFNRMFSAIRLRAAASPNEAGDRIGFLNRIFKYLYAVRRVGKRLKAWQRTTYYIFKWILFGAIMVGLFAAL